MELYGQGMSRRSITKARHMSMNSVSEVFDIADERPSAWPDMEASGDEGGCWQFYPDMHVRESIFEESDWGYVPSEMTKVGVSLCLLQDEQRERCTRSDSVAMGYTRFCERYGEHVAATGLNKRIQHKTGVSCEVDWSEPTLGRVAANPDTCEIAKIYLFVGVLPFSQKAHFEPAPDMREHTVCDNLKTGVVKHPGSNGHCHSLRL